MHIQAVYKNTLVTIILVITNPLTKSPSNLQPLYNFFTSNPDQATYHSLNTASE